MAVAPDAPVVSNPTDDVPDESRVDDLGDRLVAAAAEVFAEQGYDRAGVQEIARRAGVTTGAIYSRHRGKAELMVEAVRVHCTGPLDDLMRPELGTDTATRLAVAGAHIGQRGLGLGQALLLEAAVAARRDPDLRAVLNERMGERLAGLEATIVAGQVAGSVDPDIDTYAIVHLSSAIALGYLVQDAVGIEGPTPEAWNDIIGRLVSILGGSDPQRES